MLYGGDEDPRVAQITATANTKAVQTVTLTDEVYNALKNSKTAYFQLYKSAAGFTEVKEAMILNGTDTSATYIAHEEQNVTFPFAEGQRLLKNCKLGDTGIIQNRKRIILDGTENWVVYSAVANTFQLELSNSKAALCMCTHYKSITTGLTNVDYACLVNNTSLTIKDKDISTVEQLKSFLAQQYSAGTPVTVEYELAEPETTPYTEAQKTAKAEIDKLKTYKGVTYITTDSKAILDVSYKKDLEILINNISNAGEG